MAYISGSVFVYQNYRRLCTYSFLFSVCLVLIMSASVFFFFFVAYTGVFSLFCLQNLCFYAGKQGSLCLIFCFCLDMHPVLGGFIEMVEGGVPPGFYGPKGIKATYAHGRRSHVPQTCLKIEL